MDCSGDNLTCSVPWACEQGTPPTFSWEGPSVSSLGPNITHSSVLTLTPRPQDHGTNLTCQVKFPAAGVTTERTIQLNVTWAGKEAWVPGLGLLCVHVLGAWLRGTAWLEALLQGIQMVLSTKTHTREVQPQTSTSPFTRHLLDTCPSHPP
uniref:Ig-like domain-containing protein n=1 Tax=Spermophilus dauricus TaxID=99837 RepID=A0A8C9PY75_SPEDA